VRVVFVGEMLRCMARRHRWGVIGMRAPALYGLRLWLSVFLVLGVTGCGGASGLSNAATTQPSVASHGSPVPAPVGWSSKVMPARVRLLDGVSCATVSACVAVGAGAAGPAVVVGLGGSAWRTGSVRGEISLLLDFYSVSCPSTSRCIAASDGGPYLTTDAGRTWVLAKLPADIARNEPALNAVSCASVSICVAVGDLGIFRSADGGGTWALLTSVNAPAERAISCSGSTCLAVAGQALVSNDGGASWQSGVTPTGVSGLVAASCASSSVCVAVGSGSTTAEEGATFTSDGGRSWTASSTPPHGVVDAVACPTANSCFASGANSAGGSGEVFRTSDGGRSWSSVTPPLGAERLYGIDCVTDRACVAVGKGLSQVFFTLDAGTTWH